MGGEPHQEEEDTPRSERIQRGSGTAIEVPNSTAQWVRVTVLPELIRVAAPAVDLDAS